MQKEVIRLTENELKNIIKESVKNVVSIMAEANNPAFDTDRRNGSMKQIWDVIKRKQENLYDMVFGRLSDKLDDMTRQKMEMMGKEYLDIPDVICRAGNDKLPERVLIINMSSSLMCPSFYMGLCQIKNGACYAQRDENQYTTTVMPQRFKTDLMHTQMLRQYQNGNKKPMKEYFRIIELYIQLANKYATDIYKKNIEEAERISMEINGRSLSWREREAIKFASMSNKITDVRLNETGDFHCQLAVDLWANFAKKIKKKYGINTHAYTARNLDFSKASQHINMNYSHGGNYESEHQAPRFFQVISDSVYDKLTPVKLNTKCQPILGPSFNGQKYYKCPCSDKSTKCNLCGVCFNKNETGESYVIVVKLHGLKNASGLKGAYTIKEMKPILDKYEEYGWMNDSEKGHSDVKSLRDFSDNVLRLRKDAAKKTKNNTSKKKK
jgi:hypothetical protein